MVALTRAREAATDSSELGADRPAPSADRLGVEPPAGRRRHFFLAELLFADSGSGRRWSSGGRGDRWCDADVGFAESWAALGRRRRAQRATGSSTTDRKICSTDSGALASLAQRAAAARTISRIWPRYHNRCPHARARGGRRFQRAGADRAAPSWPSRLDAAAASPFLFSGIVVRRFGATMELGRSGRSSD